MSGLDQRSRWWGGVDSNQRPRDYETASVLPRPSGAVSCRPVQVRRLSWTVRAFLRALVRSRSVARPEARVGPRTTHGGVHAVGSTAYRTAPTVKGIPPLLHEGQGFDRAFSPMARSIPGAVCWYPPTRVPRTFRSRSP